MKELVKDTELKLITIPNLKEKLIAFSLQILSAVVGFLSAGAGLWGGISPLGISVVSGVPIKYMPSAGLGAMIGYILPFDGAKGLKYIAALLGVATIRMILTSINQVPKGAILSAVTAAVVMTGVGLAAAGDNLIKDGALGVAEGLLAGGGAYFISRATEIDLNKASLSEEQSASLLIAVNLILTSLYPVMIDRISIGKIAMIVLILLTARYGKTASATICSVAAAATVLISGGNVNSAIVLCFSGLTSGILASLGRLPSAVSPAAVTGIWVIVSSANPYSTSAFLEAVISGVVFLVLPKSVGLKAAKLIAVPVKTPDANGLRKTLTMRLGLASTALHGVSETVDEVSRCLQVAKKPTFNTVMHTVENDVCRGCSFMLHCWERERQITTDAVMGMCEAIRRCQPIGLAEVPGEFKEKCLRIERFEDSLTRHYTEFLGAVSAEKRVTEMREVVSDQMNGIADMLGELAEEFRTAQKYDIKMAGRVSAALGELDLRPSECCCVVDKFGRMTVEIRLAEVPEIPINRARILSRIEEVCDRDFEPPEINRAGNGCYITVTEKAVFTVDAFVTQFNQGKNKHCGDTCKFFTDGRGRFVVIISDGMGSGGRAAVDSAMTAGLAERLIKAGFGYDCTLRLVNSAMLFKSSDESLATLDISCFDLHTGRLELNKAGAAPTLVRRNGRTGRAECRSLPTGILHEVGFDKAAVTLKDDDILVMVSDGACTDGTDWICAEIESWQGGGAKQLSEKIATAARRRRHDGHDDDITVFAAIVEKAV